LPATGGGMEIQGQAVSIEPPAIDAPTGLADRSGFEVQARHALEVCRRLRLSATLMIFGLDEVRALREARDDAGADRVLRRFADALRGVLRGSDVIGHRGDGVFQVLLLECGAAATPMVLARLRAALADGSADFSVGGAEFLPERHSTIGQLLDDADAELYSQKHARD